MAYIQRSDSGRFQFAVSSNDDDAAKADGVAAATPVAETAHNPLHNRTSSGDSSQNPDYAVHDADKRGCRGPGCQQPGERFVGATVLVCGTVALAAAGAGYMAPTYVDDQLNAGLSMCNSNASAFEGWEAKVSLEEDGTSAHLGSIPAYKLYYFWSIENKEEWLAGEVTEPTMVEKGPYALQEKTMKVDVSFDEESGTVTYKDWTYADFDPFLSCDDCSLDDEVTNLNPFWLSVINSIGQESLFFLGSYIPQVYAAVMDATGGFACNTGAPGDLDFVSYAQGSASDECSVDFLTNLSENPADGTTFSMATCAGLDSAEEALVLLTHAGTIAATSPTVTQAGTDIGTDRYTAAYGYAATVSGCIDPTTGGPADCTGTDFNTYCGAFGGAGAATDACQGYITGEALFAGTVGSGTSAPCEAVGLGTAAGAPACSGLPVPCTDAADVCYTDFFGPHAEFYNTCVAAPSTGNACTTLIGDVTLASVIAAGGNPAADPTYLYIAGFQQNTDSLVGIYAANGYTIAQEDLLNSLSCLNEWYAGPVDEFDSQLKFHYAGFADAARQADPASCSEGETTGCLLTTTRTVEDLLFGYVSPLGAVIYGDNAPTIPGYQTSYDNEADVINDPENLYNTQSTGCGNATQSSVWQYSSYQEKNERCFSPLNGDDEIACQAVEGTDGAGYEPLGVAAWERFDITQGYGWTKDAPHDSLTIYVDTAKRSLQIDYVEDVEVQGVTLAQYAPSTELLIQDNTVASRSGDIGVGVPVDGVQSLAPFMNFNVYISSPHFLNSPELAYETSNVADHATYINIEPATGKTMDFHNRLQANFGVGEFGKSTALLGVNALGETEDENGRTVTYSASYDAAKGQADVTPATRDHMTAQTILPQYWADHTATIDENTASSLKTYQSLHSYATLAVYAGGAAGVVLLCLGTVLLVKASKHRRQAALNAELAAAAQAANMGEGRV